MQLEDEMVALDEEMRDTQYALNGQGGGYKIGS